MRNWILSIIFIFTIASFGQLSADENPPHYPGYEILAGAGYLELFYGGLRINTAEGIWFGLRAGTVPEEMVSKLRSISVDIYIDLSEKSKYYIKPGIAYNYKETDQVISNMFFFNIQAGRGFSFTKNTGIRLDAGVNLLIKNIEIKKESYEEPFLDDLNINLFPGINLEFYYLL